DILLCGSTSGFGAGGTDVYLVEIDSNGTVLHDHFIGDAGNESANHIEQTADGGFVIAGYTTSNTPGYDVYLLKTDCLFNLQWSRNFGTAGNDYGYSVKQDVDGNLMVLGAWANGPDSSTISLIKTDSMGLNPVVKFPGGHAGDMGFSLND